MAALIKKSFILFAFFSVMAINAQSTPSDFAYINQISNALMKLLYPFNAYREGENAAENVFYLQNKGIPSSRISTYCDDDSCQLHSNYSVKPQNVESAVKSNGETVISNEENKKSSGNDNASSDVWEIYLEEGIVCDGTQEFECRGEDWDYESETIFSQIMMDLQYLTEDLEGVVPPGTNWVSSQFSQPSGSAGNILRPFFGLGGINILPEITSVREIFNPSKLLTLPAEFVPAITSAVSGTATAALALPAELFALKTAKPLAWKLGIAAKAAFLKLVFLKKLLLVKAKVGALILSKGAYLAFQFMIMPLLKGLGFFKIIVSLAGGLKTLDCLMNSYEACESNQSPEDSVMLNILPWFAQHKEENLDVFSIFKMPNELFENLVSEHAFTPDFFKSLPQIGLPTEATADFSELFSGNFANIFRPSLRKSEPSANYNDITLAQNAFQSAFNNLMGGFTSALQCYNELLIDSQKFMRFAADQNPDLLDLTLNQELLYRLKISESVVTVITTKYMDDGMTGQLAAADSVPSIEAIDAAFITFAQSVQ